MDQKKDIQEIKRENPLESAIYETRVDPFGQNISGKQAYIRSERILAAIYLLTKKTPDTEIVRNKVRESGHALLQSAMSLKDGVRQLQNETIGAIHAHAREIVSYTGILVLAGYVSKTNADILVGAIDDLVAFVNSTKSPGFSEPHILERDDLSPQRKLSVHDVPTAVTHQLIPKRPQPRKPFKQALKEGSRRDTILSVLRLGGAYGIKDIHSQVPGCSEKTIQRELAALVGDGVVKKEGEKRWSRYSI